MNKFLRRITTIAPLALVLATFLGCEDPPAPEPQKDLHIVFLVDGTDDAHKVRQIPVVEVLWFQGLLGRLQTNLVSARSIHLFVQYVSANAERNKVAYVQISSPPDQSDKRKIPSESQSAYNARESALIDSDKAKNEAWLKANNEQLQTFYAEVNSILKEAYSTKIKQARRGSDIHSAVHLALANLRSIRRGQVPGESAHELIIACSDLEDNVKAMDKPSIHDGILLWVVNTTSGTHQDYREGIHVPNFAVLEAKLLNLLMMENRG